MVKRFLREGRADDRWGLSSKKPIKAGHEEQRANPRARSAVLRGGVRHRMADEPHLDVSGGEPGSQVEEPS